MIWEVNGAVFVKGVLLTFITSGPGRIRAVKLHKGLDHWNKGYLYGDAAMETVILHSMFMLVQTSE